MFGFDTKSLVVGIALGALVVPVVIKAVKR